MNIRQTSTLGTMTARPHCTCGREGRIFRTKRMVLILRCYCWSAARTWTSKTRCIWHPTVRRSRSDSCYWIMVQKPMWRKTDARPHCRWFLRTDGNTQRWRRRCIAIFGARGRSLCTTPASHIYVKSLAASGRTTIAQWGLTAIVLHVRFAPWSSSMRAILSIPL